MLHRNLGRRTSLTRGNGTSAAYTYDGASRLSQLVEDMSGTSNDLTLGFSYNPAAQITSNTRSNTAYSYTARVNGAVTDTINGLNQVTATGGATVAYGDARGNITGIGSDAYSYTSENRLATANVGGAMFYLPYRSDGALHEIYRGADGSETVFDYAGQNIVTERDDNWIITARYVWGPGSNEPLVWYNGADLSSRRFLHADERGSIVAVSDSSGAVTNVNTYDEYGVPAAGNVGRFQYTGQAWIPEIQLYYYRARFYNPRLGRFMQTDPIGYEGGMNLYAYVGGDPVNMTDPSGLKETCMTTGSHICQPKDYICSSCSGGSTGGFGPPVSGHRSGGGSGGGSGGSTGSPATYGGRINSSRLMKSQEYRIGDCPGLRCFEGEPWLWEQPGNNYYGIAGLQFAQAGVADSRTRSDTTSSDVARACGRNRASAACAEIQRQYLEDYTRRARENPLPPIPDFDLVRPDLSAVVGGLFGCGVALRAGGGGTLGGIATATGCWLALQDLGRYLIPAQNRR